MDVRLLREGLGLSQRELALRLGVSQPTVVRLESGLAELTEEMRAELWLLEQRARKVSRLDSYPSAPGGGKPGSREAELRLAWVNARNRAIQAGLG